MRQMSWFPFRLESKASQAPSGETENPSITCDPVVICFASRSETDLPRCSGIAATLEVSL
jgi:hypothetical protein